MNNPDTRSAKKSQSQAPIRLPARDIVIVTSFILFFFLLIFKFIILPEQETLSDPKQPSYLHQLPEFHQILLREIILQEIPDWFDLSQWEQVIALRQWAHEQVDITATDKVRFDADTTLRYYDQPAGILYQWFQEDKGGVYCGGSAYFLQKIYELMDFPAYALDMGRNGVFSHVVLIVPVKHNGKTLRTIQDVFFNLTYHRAIDGRPCDIHTLMADLVTGRYENIVPDPGEEGERTFYLDLEDDEVVKYWQSRITFRDTLSNHVGRYTGHVDHWAMIDFLSAHIQRVTGNLVTQVEPLVLFPYAFAVYGPADSVRDQLQELVDSLKASNPND